MRAAVLILTLGVLAALAAVWWAGGFDAAATWAAARQREVQNTMAELVAHAGKGAWFIEALLASNSRSSSKC